MPIKALVSTIRGAPLANRYDFNTQDLLENKEIQKLIADSSLADVAQRYLGACPLVDVVAMWWSTDFSKTLMNKLHSFFTSIWIGLDG